MPWNRFAKASKAASDSSSETEPSALTERDEFGCELWRGRRKADGYGMIGKETAHRVVWERERGPIPEDRFLDHLCRRPACVALHHLEIVTASENESRKRWRNRIKATHCPAGHEMASNAVVTPEGGRVCRACNRLAVSE
jgi:hypothetical protein